MTGHSHGMMTLVALAVAFAHIGFACIAVGVADESARWDANRARARKRK